MYFDNERTIIDQFKTEAQNVLLLRGNSFEKSICEKIFDFDNASENNAHEAPPPDYYSELHSIMYDVLRVNDSELRKGYNPIKMREKEIVKTIMETFGDCFPNVTSDNIIPILRPSQPNEKHEYKLYVKQAKRVIEAHIRKTPIWVSEHPNIKYKGLLICDETELYFESAIPIAPYIERRANGEIFAIPINKLHKPWLDKNLCQIFCESGLDFVIWYMPCKRYDPFILDNKVNYPAIVVMDVRTPFEEYEEYDISSLLTTH